MPWLIAMLFSNFGSATNVLWFALSMQWNISKSPCNVRIFGRTTSSQTSSSFFITDSFLPFVDKLTFSLHIFWLHFRSLSDMGSRAHIPMVIWVFSTPTYVGFEFYFQPSAPFLLCCTSIFVGWCPLPITHFWKNVKGIYHWDTRSQHRCMLAVCAWTE